MRDPDGGRGREDWRGNGEELGRGRDPPLLITSPCCAISRGLAIPEASGGRSVVVGSA